MIELGVRLHGARPGPWLWISLLFAACSVEPSPPKADPVCVGPNCDRQDASPAPEVSAPDAAPVAPRPADAAAATSQSELCPGRCVPDDAKSCVNRGDLALFELQVGVDLFGADAGASLDGGAGADAGIESEDAGMSYPLPPSTSVTGTNDGSAEADAGQQVNDEQDAGDGGYHGSAPGTIVPPVLDAALDTSPPAIREGCQLMPDPDGSVLAKCDVAGVGQDGSSCISSADCAPGLGCVSDEAEVGATCMRYCCEGDASCSDNRFCTRRPLKTAVVTSEPVMVPVCAPSEQCDLMDPYPCPVDGDCKCPSGTACAPVGKDGARRCAAPGNGQSGEACPCAAGYFCSSAQVCLKLCQADLDDCGSGICQPIGGFPEQWGLCVNLPG